MSAFVPTDGGSNRGIVEASRAVVADPPRRRMTFREGKRSTT
jgi:hypothetical protein